MGGERNRSRQKADAVDRAPDPVIIRWMQNEPERAWAAGLEGVFLDFYGTVAGGDRAAVERVCQSVVEDHAIPMSAHELAVAWGTHYFAAIETCDDRPFQTLVEIERDTLTRTLDPLVGPVAVDGYIEQLSAYLAAPILFPEVRSAIEGCRLPICIVSNADDRELLTAVGTFGLRFDHIVTSESARSYKPSERIFRFALERTGWSPERVVHIGDSLHSDVGGAKKLGLRTVWLHRPERMSDIGEEVPDATFGDLAFLSKM